MTGSELQHITRANINHRLAGDGPFTELCHAWLEQKIKGSKALLTHSCTAALEMTSILLDIKPGDEIIMPSYTFVSTANSFVLRGGVPVFVDIRDDTLNINERLIESAITKRTKAIVPVHYAGVSCEMDLIMQIAKEYSLKVVEDAAQAIMSSYKGRPLGGIGDFGAFSFHETKNLISGEGGALIVNDHNSRHRAEVVREKGTNRSVFFRGEVDKYTWQDIGSSFLPGELTAAFLWAQLEQAENITKLRLEIWMRYHNLLESLEFDGLIRRPIVPLDCDHNAHMYYVLLNDKIDRQRVLERMKADNINAIFHYIPLHSSPAGFRYCRTHGSMENTNKKSEQLVRLPLWVGLSKDLQKRVVESLHRAIIDE